MSHLSAIVRCLALASALLVSGTAWAQLPLPFVPQTLAEQAGMRRGWVQRLVDVGPRQRLTNLTLSGDLLLATSSNSTLIAIETETGHVRWTIQIGRAGPPVLAPSADKDGVVVAHGSKIYLIDRSNGRIVWSHTLTGTPYLPPLLMEKFVATPVMPGQLEVVDRTTPESKVAPDGEVQLVNPIRLATSQLLAGPAVGVENFAVWLDTTGRIVANTPLFDGLQYRIEADGPAAASPTWYGDDLFVPTLTGYLHCYDDHHGRLRWSFAVDEEIRKPAVVIGDQIFVVAERRGLWCVDRETGQSQWFCPDIRDFVSESKGRVYTLNRWNQLAILDLATGQLRQTMPLPERTFAVANSQSDRIFLANADGTVQQLHESFLNEPLVHTLPKWTPQTDSRSTRPAASAPPASAAPAAPAPAPGDSDTTPSTPSAVPPSTTPTPAPDNADGLFNS